MIPPVAVDDRGARREAERRALVLAAELAEQFRNRLFVTHHPVGSVGDVADRMVAGASAVLRVAVDNLDFVGEPVPAPVRFLAKRTVESFDAWLAAGPDPHELRRTCALFGVSAFEAGWGLP